MSVLLGVDLGTSSVKAGLFTSDGGCLAMVSVAYRPDAPRPGWAEIPPARWWRSFIAALDLLRAERTGCLRDVCAIGFSVLYPALVPMDASGKPLRSAILYCDGRSSAQVDRLVRDGSLPRIESLTADRVVPGTCSGTSMAWVRDNEPEVYRRTRYFGHANTYIVSRLTGRIAIDPTNASLTGLSPIGDGGFSGELADLFGLDPEKLPPIAPSAGVVGVISRRAARATGLPAGTPVVMGAGDAICAALGAGVAKAGEVFYVAGTTDCAVVTTDRPPDDLRFANMSYCLPGLWASTGTMTSTGAAADWFARAFLGESASPLDAERLASGCDPGAGGLLFLPYLQGERTPVWDPDACGVFIGLQLSTGLREQARAVFEGTAFGLRQVMESLEEAYDLNGAKIRSVGGCTRNELWMQIKASVLGRPIQVLEYQDTSTLGAALLAGIGIGAFATPSHAVRATAGLRRHRTVYPQRRWQAVYDAYYPIYCRLYGALRDEFHALRRVP